MTFSRARPRPREDLVAVFATVIPISGYGLVRAIAGCKPLLALALLWASAARAAEPAPTRKNDRPQPPPQVPIIRPDDSGKIIEPSTYLSDASVRRRLAEAQRLAGEGRLDQTLGLLQAILDEPDESFVKDEASGWQTARRAAEIEIEKLGPRGIAAYRRRYEDQAAYLLRAARAAHDARGQGEVLRRFFLTRAGFDAANLLATYQLDRRRPALALAYLDRLLESPIHREAVTDAMRAKRGVALALLGREPDARRTLEGTEQKELRLGAAAWPPAAILEALNRRGESSADRPAGERNWSNWGMDRARRSEAAGSAPLVFPDWTSPLVSNSRSELFTVFEGIADMNRAQRRGLEYGLGPVAWNGVVYFRNFRETVALELETGRVLWNARGATSLESEFEQAYPRFFGAIASLPGVQSTFVGNTLHGAIGTDGERVYQIDELVLNPAAYPGRVGANGAAIDPVERGRNRLVALEIGGGKVAWSLGGSASDKGPRSAALADTFFLGPPLAVEGDLFVLGERRSEIRLFCLDPVEGKLRWSQVIALAQRPIEADLFRQTQACYLAYEDGVLVCPTNLFRVVGVDPLTRTVLWHFPHAELAGQVAPQFAPMQFVSPPVHAHASDPPLLVGGRVVISSAQGNLIHAIDLTTGQPRWRIDREGAQYIAGAGNQAAEAGSAPLVLLVANDHMRAHRIEDGGLEWKTPIDLPAGRGVLLGEMFLVPLADGTVLLAELATGKIARKLAPRRPGPLGNLIVQGNYVLAAGPAGLQAFPMVEPIRAEADRALAANPAQPRGLFRRAQLRLTAGDTAGAIADLLVLARAPADDGLGERSRDLMFDLAAREATRDPAPLGSFLTELERFTTSVERKGIYLRLLAEHRLAAGDVIGAAEAIDRHAELGLVELIPDEGERVARHARVWNRMFIRKLLSAVKGGDGEKLQAAIATRIESADRAGDIPNLELLAATYAGLGQGDAAFLRLGERLRQAGRLGEAEWAFLSVGGYAERKAETSALAGLAAVAEAANQPNDARYWRDRSANPPPPGPAGGVARGPASEPPPELAFDAVEVRSYRNTRMDASRRLAVGVTGELPYLADKLFAFNQQATSLECYRGGSERREWRVTLPQAQNILWPVRLESMGHLLFLATGDMVHGISALDQRLLWSRRFALTNTGINQAMIFPRPPRPRDMNHALAKIGPGFVAIHTGKDLNLVDPWTGRDLWRKKTDGALGFVFGDHEVLFLTANDGGYQVLRTVDGTLVRLGRFGPSFGQRRAIVGRRLALVAEENGKTMVRLWDPLEKKSQWSRSFPSGTRHFPGEEDELILLAPTGGLVVLDPATGATLFEDKLEPDFAPRVQALRVFADARRWFLAIEPRPQGTRAQFPMASMPPNLASCPLSGPLRAYDKTSGKRLWERSITNLAAVVRPGADLPVLLCSGTRPVEREKNARPFVSQIEILDKRDGRTLHVETQDDFVQVAEIAYDLEDRWVELRAWNSKTRIEFRREANGGRKP